MYNDLESENFYFYTKEAEFIVNGKSHSGISIRFLGGV